MAVACTAAAQQAPETFQPGATSSFLIFLRGTPVGDIDLTALFRSPNDFAAGEGDPRRTSCNGD